MAEQPRALVVAPSTDTMQLAFEQAFNAICITDAVFDGYGPYITAVNPAFCAMTGYSPDELIGSSPRILQGPDTDPRVIARLRDALHAGTYFFGSTINYRRDGSPYVVEWNVSALRDEGRVVGFVSVQQDISARVAAAREQALFTLVGHLMPTPLLITDANHTITFANHAFERLSGYSSDDLIGASPRLLATTASDDTDPSTLVQRLNRGEDVQQRVELRRSDGRTVQVDHHGMPLRFNDDALTHHVHTFIDVTDLVTEGARWREMATLDPLTGLLNRRGADAGLEAAYQGAQTQGTGFAALVLDLDHFKRVNDDFGHPEGDRVLARVARAMQAVVRGDDLVARLGGEEFLVLAQDIGAETATALAERLRQRLASLDHGRPGTVTASVGLAMWRPGLTPADVVANADAALYEAKQAGRDRVVVHQPV